jgi:NAD(P)H-dependent flavin oxidoreductase YrpB (nitropropane dioxygenase family)
MLTYNDVTIENAHEVYEKVKDSGVEYIGFKDIGLPFEELLSLTKKIQKDGHKAVLEIVSLSDEAMERSVETALKLGVDYAIGGTKLQKKLLNSNIKYFPYIGKVTGHPAVLSGTIEEIVAEAKEKEALGMDGFNLLAYRYQGNAEELVKAVQKEINIPLICAGAIDNFEKIKYLKALNVWGFTIGGAIVKCKMVPGGSIEDQMKAVLDAAK